VSEEETIDRHAEAEDPGYALSASSEHEHERLRRQAERFAPFTCRPLEHGYELSRLAVERARARVLEAGLTNVEIFDRRGRGDPAVRVVLALCESVADRSAVGAQLGAYRHELGPVWMTSARWILLLSLSIRASPQPRWIARSAALRPSGRR
jgi:hypothetical protein